MIDKLLHNIFVKNFIGMILFVILLCSSIYGVSFCLQDKDSTYKNEAFFSENTQFDVLLFGSSHMELYISPLELWREYGITSYNFGAPEEGLPVTYWVMKNAFEYNCPKVAVVDMYMFDNSGNYSTDSYVHYALDSFPLTEVKIEAINDLSENINQKLEMYFTLGKYHSNWKNITDSSFYDKTNYIKGSMSYGYWHTARVTPFEQYPLTDSVSDIISDNRDLLYLDRIIELCNEKGVKLLLVSTPYICSEENQKKIHLAEIISSEKGVDYINFVSMNSIIDTQTDLYDIGHVNQSGMRKVTDYLGSYLVDRYELNDKRSDASYSDWWEDYKDYYGLKLATFHTATDNLEVMLELLHDSDLSSYIYMGSEYSGDVDDELIKRLLHNIGRTNITVSSDAKIKSCDMKTLNLLERSYGTQDYLVACKSGKITNELTGEAAFAEIKKIIDDDICSDCIVIAVTDSDTGNLRFVKKYNSDLTSQLLYENIEDKYLKRF